MVFSFMVFTMKSSFEVSFRDRKVGERVEKFAMVAKFNGRVVSREFSEEAFVNGVGINIISAVFQPDV